MQCYTWISNYFDFLCCQSRFQVSWVLHKKKFSFYLLLVYLFIYFINLFADSIKKWRKSKVFKDNAIVCESNIYNLFFIKKGVK